VLAGGLQVAAHGAKGFGTCKSPEAPTYFPLQLDHPEVAFGPGCFVAGTAGSAQYLVTSWRRSLKQHSKL